MGETIPNLPAGEAPLNLVVYTGRIPTEMQVAEVTRQLKFGETPLKLDGFLQGGPPQIETFDPKLDVASDNRSCTGEVRTNLPGVWFGGTLSRMAQRADRFSTTIIPPFGTPTISGSVGVMIGPSESTMVII